jgi:chorismate mutase
MMRLWGIRGATTLNSDSKEEMVEAVAELVAQIQSRNNLDVADIVSAIFTTSPDLVSAFPATCARQAGWSSVPMLCMHELAPEGSLSHCLRVLVHAYLPAAPRHVYLKDARRLRPDLVEGED